VKTMKGKMIVSGIVLVVVAMMLMPSASALSITQKKFEALAEVENINIYSMDINNNVLYLTGIDVFHNEIVVYSWKGQGYTPVKEAHAKISYDYYPTDTVWFKNKMYISLLNGSAPDPHGMTWSTSLYAFDPSEKIIYEVAKFNRGALTQTTVFGKYLIITGDFNTFYYSTNGVTFTARNILDTIEGEDSDYYYLYHNWIIGVATVNDMLVFESRNCSYAGDKTTWFAPITYTIYSDYINFYSLKNLTDNYTVTQTTNRPTQVIIYKDVGTHRWNHTNPIFPLSTNSIAFVSDRAVSTYNPDTGKITRLIQGDTDRNPAPLFASHLTNDKKFYTMTLEGADITPSCPDLGGGGGSRSRTWSLTEFDLQSGKKKIDIVKFPTNFIYDIINYEKGSIVFATSNGAYTYHDVIVSFDAQISQLMFALLIIGIIMIMFGVLSWNKGFEDVISLSAGISLVTTSGILYVYPAIYLSWLLVLVPITLFFLIMYAFIKTYHLEKLDFRLSSMDAIWIVIILAVIVAVEIFTGLISTYVYPAWLPPP
jgi:hypothetical protein